MLTRTTLKNGIPVLLMPYPKMNRVVVESFYRVGFVHEPEGMTQAAHLLEHLVCYSATKSYKAGESFGLLTRKGMANAETMGSFTHYDYLLPSGEMELAIKIEAERISSLKITQEIIRQEAPRCHSEAIHVENVLQAGMFKFGMMAINQGWRYGAKQAKVRTGLENIRATRMQDFYRKTYRPERACIVVTGGFRQEQAIRLLNHHLGSVRAAAPLGKMPLAHWTRMPKDLTMHWDSRTQAVCIAFPPPSGLMERFLMTLWGQVMMMRGMSSRLLMPLTDAFFCSNPGWAVGEIPFFLYAAAKPGVKLSDLQHEMLKQVGTAIAAPPTLSEIASMQMMAKNIDLFFKGDEAMLQMMIQQMERTAGSETRATDMALGNLAIQLGIHELLLGQQRQAMLKEVRRLKSDALHRLVKRTLDPAKRSIVRLTS